MTRLAALLLALALAAPAGAAPLATRLFGAETTPSKGPADPIGSYARGCAGGNVALPESGPTWQAMRLSRDRYWGNPVTIAFLEDLSRYAARQPGWKGLYIGDIGQPRGGPMRSGHQSHQMGLDADVWFLPPKSVHLSRAAREKIGSISVRTADQKHVNANFTRSTARILERAAKDRRVDRIFVAAAIKLKMCKSARRSDTWWMQKLRPWYGHNDHFHVRLKCPPGARDCQTQRPTVAQLSHGGNGCDKSLDWWVTTYLYNLKHPPPPPKHPKPHRRGPRQFVMSDLPAKCAALLSER
jgi:penicillin-insensitive murein endopeptidase